MTTCSSRPAFEISRYGGQQDREQLGESFSKLTGARTFSKAFGLWDGISEQRLTGVLPELLPP